MDLSGAFNALFEWLASLWADFVEFLTDIPILILDGVLGAVGSLIASIPSPDFLTGGIQSLFGDLPSDILFFLDVFNISAAMALIGAGFAFRLTRKVLTLFQW